MASAAATAGTPPVANRGAITACVILAVIMQALDTTIANVALPYIQGSVSASADQINWVLTSYIVAAAIMTPPSGFLAARFGRKRVLSAAIIGFVVASILRVSCSSTLEAVWAGALLSPASEFAFVLLPLGLANGLLAPQQAAIVTALAAISMLLGPLVAKLIDVVLLARIGAETMDEDFDGADGSQVMVIGFGRFGQVVTQALLLQHVNITVIDSDVEQIRAAARFGFKVYYGDGTRLDVLRAAGAGKARVICICVDSKDAALRTLEMVKAEFPNVRVHARAFDRIHAIELMKANVDYQMRETFESALDFGRVTLEAVGLTRDEADLVIDHVRDRDAQRMEIQFHEGIAAALNQVPRVMPEPLIKPKGKPKALTVETQEVIEDGGAEVAVGGVGEPER